jgi:hypothetical protein
MPSRLGVAFILTLAIAFCTTLLIFYVFLCTIVFHSNNWFINTMARLARGTAWLTHLPQCDPNLSKPHFFWNTDFLNEAGILEKSTANESS